VLDLTDRLRAAGCVAAEEEADLLREAAGDGDSLELLVRRREAGEPLAWLVGWAELAGRRVAVESGVYVPRPQTGELARRAASLVPPGGRLADLCAGSGAIASWVRRARPDVAVVAVDLDERAVRCAGGNHVAALQAAAGAVPLRSACVDVVTAVAPYVPTSAIAYLPADVQRHEPRRALDGGADGLTVVREVVESARRLLRTGGWLVVELGAGQPALLAPDLVGFTDVVVWRDDEGDVRGLAARLADGERPRVVARRPAAVRQPRSPSITAANGGSLTISTIVASGSCSESGR